MPPQTLHRTNRAKVGGAPVYSNTRTLYKSKRALLIEHLALSDKKPFKILRVPDEKLIAEFTTRENAVHAWDVWYADGSHVK